MDGGATTAGPKVQARSRRGRWAPSLFGGGRQESRLPKASARLAARSVAKMAGRRRGLLSPAQVEGQAVRGGLNMVKSLRSIRSRARAFPTIGHSANHVER
jgi:hypothetical protein